MVKLQPTTEAGLVSSSVTLLTSNGVQAKTDEVKAEVLQTAPSALLPKPTHGQWEESFNRARLEMDKLIKEVIEKETEPKKIVLDNGLTIIADEIPDEMACNIRVYVKVGSSHEKKNLGGIAHFIEHNVFNGTTTEGRDTDKEIVEQFEMIGSDENAETDRETTCYYTEVLSCFAPLALDLLLDMVINPSFNEKPIAKEKGIVIEEMKMYRDSPDWFTEDMLFRYVLRNYMGRLITGTKESISGFTKESLTQFANDFYTPDNIVISMAGRFNLDEMLEKAKSYTAQITRKKKELELPIPKYSSGIRIFKRRDIEQTQLLFALEGIPYTSKDWYTMSLIEQCLMESRSSRLFQEIREKRGLAYTVESASGEYSSCGVFAVHTAIPGESLELVVRLILDQLKSIKNNGFTQAEIDRAKIQSKNQFVRDRRELENRASSNATDHIYFGRFRSLKEDIGKIDAVTNEDIIKLAKKIFKPEYFTLLLMAPADVDRDKQIPTKQKLEDIFSEYTLKWSEPNT